MNTQIGTDMGLTREEESCLKQQLLKLCVQDEIALFMEDPEKVNTDTLFLSFFKKKILDFPLLAMRAMATSKMEELINKLPTFLKVSQRATKHDMQNRKLRVIVVANFNSMLRTPLERQYDMRRTMENYSPEQDMKQVDDPVERTRQATVAMLAKDVARVSLAIFLELEQQGGVGRFFAIVKAHHKLSDLPPLYQSFFKYMGKLMAVEMERTYSDPTHVRSLKKLYMLTPVKAIRAILAITEASTLLDGLVHLFLARPLGTHSLLQKIAAAGTELKRSKTQLKNGKYDMMHSLKNKLDAKQIHHVLAEVHRHAQTVPLPIGEEEDIVGRPPGKEIVDYDRLVPIEVVKEIISEGGVLTEGDIQCLNDDEIASIRNILVLEMRVKDKSDFVELLGTHDTTDIIREIFPIFDELLATLKRADFGTHLEKYFKAMKSIVKVSEAAKDQDVTERIASYENALETMQEDLYFFIHCVCLSDNEGALYKTLEWYVDMLRFVHRREGVDIQKLLVPLPQEERAEIKSEVDEVLEYYKTTEKAGAPPAKRPVVQNREVKNTIFGDDDGKIEDPFI